MRKGDGRSPAELLPQATRDGQNMSPGSEWHFTDISALKWLVTAIENASDNNSKLYSISFVRFCIGGRFHVGRILALSEN